MALNDTPTRFQLRDMFDPHKADIKDWFVREDMYDTMRTALLLCIQQDMMALAASAFPLEQLQPWREFFVAVLSRKTYATKDRGIIDRVSFVAQMIDKGSWERQQLLIGKFLINLREEA